ncbi:hypothetical protein KJ707_02255 [Patescibacteria group bacterium]|nr:hypothetical protein [Patescibacteria group bacterium]MBU2543359.1 hypothetical protein [Patescibacteria group bacterium]
MRKNIQALAFIPHSIPRKIPFLKVFESKLSLAIPRIELVKAYSGDLPVAQKSLSKLSEGIRGDTRDLVGRLRSQRLLGAGLLRPRREGN